MFANQYKGEQITKIMIHLQVVVVVTDLKENLPQKEFPEEDLIHLDELKKCFEHNKLPEVTESQIQILGESATILQVLTNSSNG